MTGLGFRGSDSCGDTSAGGPMIGTASFGFERVGWGLVAAFLVAVVAFGGTPSPPAQALALGGTLVAFAHGARIYGWSGIAIFLAVSLVVTFALENLGIATGFPFGRYHFEVAAGLPHIGAVPIVVGLLYFAMGYFSWMIAS